MSLLPRSQAEFQQKDYWEKFFSKRSAPFEWYGEYLDLCDTVHKYAKPASRILVVGCGNSKLSEDMYDAGFHGIDNIDISDVVIRQMVSRNKLSRPDMKFIKMDLLDMTYSDALFDCVIDKGTLDAIFSNTDDATVQKVDRMFQEVGRVLKIAGRYLCITLAQDHILQKLLQHFDESDWLLRVHRVLLGRNEAEGSGLGGALPVFVFVMTKMARIAGRPPLKVCEYVDEGGRCVRCEGVEGVRGFVKDHQQYAMIKHHLSSLHPGEPAVQLDLWSSSVTAEPRFTLSVVDTPKRKAKNGAFAIFIAPQGRETDWLFSSDGGRKQLAESAGFERLVVITLHRAHTYSGVERVREEVGGRAVQLVQGGVTREKTYPVLTLGDGLGSRLVLHEGHSSMSGGYVVEECEGGGGKVVRRLVFTSTPHLAQTEVRMVQAKPKKKSRKKLLPREPDHTYLTCGHHRAIVASLSFLPLVQGEGRVTVLVVGLGGGALPMYIRKHIAMASVEVVELDPEMLTVAEKWFGFVHGEEVRVCVGDGVEVIREKCASGKKGCYDVIIFDVDSKDSSAGMSSPPPAFVENEVLRNTRQLLSKDGIFVTNLAARNRDLRDSVLEAICQTFPLVLHIPVPEDVNEIVVGLSQAEDDIIGHGTDQSDNGRQPFVVTPAVKNSVANLARMVATNSSSLDIESTQKEVLEFLESASCILHVHE